ncbi:MAG: universal stress protein [Candidatus Binataceae bacterium]
MTFKRILYAVSFDEDSQAAFTAAVKFARESHGTVCLLHVLPLPNAIIYADVLAADKGRAENRLQKLAAQVPAGIGRTAIVKFGHTAHEIVETARAERADLIVMGTRGRSGIARLIHGSVARQVVQASRLPVLTVPSNEAREAGTTSIQAA